MKQIISFLQEARAELKRVTWPSRDKTIRLTTAVLAVTVAVALFVAAFDYLFNLVIQIFISKQ